MTWNSLSGGVEVIKITKLNASHQTTLGALRLFLKAVDALPDETVVKIVQNSGNQRDGTVTTLSVDDAV